MGLTMTDDRERAIRAFDHAIPADETNSIAFDRRGLLAELDATRAALAACERERDEARKANATMQRRAQAAESAALRAARIEQRIADKAQGKPLGRIEAGFALAAAETEAATLRERVRVLVDGMELAWGLIANAYGGDWAQASEDWRMAAHRWRDEQWHPALAASPAAPSGGDEREGEVPDA